MATRAAVHAANLDFFHVLGDLGYIADEQAWCNWWKDPAAGEPDTTWIAGNHETTESGPGDYQVYKTACPFTLGTPTGEYGVEFYFDYPAAGPLVRIISHTAGIGGISTTYNAGNAGYNFVSNAIDTARTAGIPWIIVSSHKGCPYPGDYSGCSYETDLQQLLFTKKVDLILNAHAHVYGRSHQLACATLGTTDTGCILDTDNSFAKGAGTVMLNIGTGGHSRRSLTDPAEAGYFSQRMDTDSGFGKFTVSDTSLSYVFVSSTGAYTDSFLIGSVSLASWNPSVSCIPTLTTLEQIVGTNTYPATGGAKGPYDGGNGWPAEIGMAAKALGYSGSAGKRWLEPDTLNPPCSWNGINLFVEVRGIVITNSLIDAETGDCTNTYNAINGGGSWGTQSYCDITGNVQSPNQGELTDAPTFDSRLLHRLHIEIDHNWQGNGYCGIGISYCDNAQIQTLPAGTAIDVQGIIYWDGPENEAGGGHVGDQWHSYSGWEIHPVTAWRLASPSPLSADFTVTPSSPSTNSPATFMATVSGGTPPYTYSWDFGDGQADTGATVSHSYGAEGILSATLTITDMLSGQITITKDVVVGSSQPPPPPPPSNQPDGGQCFLCPPLSLPSLSLFLLVLGSLAGLTLSLSVLIARARSRLNRARRLNAPSTD